MRLCICSRMFAGLTWFRNSFFGTRRACLVDDRTPKTKTQNGQPLRHRGRCDARGWQKFRGRRDHGGCMTSEVTVDDASVALPAAIASAASSVATATATATATPSLAAAAATSAATTTGSKLLSCSGHCWSCRRQRWRWRGLEQAYKRTSDFGLNSKRVCLCMCMCLWVQNTFPCVLQQTTPPTTLANVANDFNHRPSWNS